MVSTPNNEAVFSITSATLDNTIKEINRFDIRFDRSRPISIFSILSKLYERLSYMTKCIRISINFS